MPPTPPRLVRLPDGRDLAVDDVGDPDGVPVVYLHGTPDSRLSRGDDPATAAAGVRLLAVDRPGCGRSTSHPGRTLGSVADDLAATLARLGVERAAVLAWSAGAPYAVALAARHPAVVSAVGLAAPAVPITAFADPDVRLAAGPGRELFAEMAAEMAPDAVAAEVAPFTPVEGPAEEEAVALGLDGLHQEIAVQAAVPDVDLAGAAAPATIWAGTADDVAPVAFARWWAALLPGARVHEVDGDHGLHRAHWPEILATLTA
ncbi:alpha/beta hydrolase [Iamia sp. SCSIO 61187]|uniref:alpha/beta fold hydrolase n=1 Tax=Iamia sp. SCSIO 61187 TaxID=2722752 RepID=UPI001C631568|nr:alpha/beta hydrolase [Iamia sp. SCSIO 61187]QYG91613.1 alpha/beta hydrolase [Iamia sp. SCSIO 61187]